MITEATHNTIVDLLRENIGQLSRHLRTAGVLATDRAKTERLLKAREDALAEFIEQEDTLARTDEEDAELQRKRDEEIEAVTEPSIEEMLGEGGE